MKEEEINREIPQERRDEMHYMVLQSLMVQHTMKEFIRDGCADPSSADRGKKPHLLVWFEVFLGF